MAASPCGEAAITWTSKSKSKTLTVWQKSFSKSPGRTLSPAAHVPPVCCLPMHRSARLWRPVQSTRTGRATSSGSTRAAGCAVRCVPPCLPAACRAPWGIIHYAPHVEYGHRQKAGRFVPVLGKRLKASFVPGQYFLRSAVDDTRPEFYADLKKTMEE